MRAVREDGGTQPRPGNRRRMLPWAVLALWVAVIALAGPLAGRLADVQTNRAVDYLPASADSVTVTGQSSAVMTILVFGAGTDYALLLVSRYREELSRAARPYDAMAAALRGCGPAVLASSGTVAAGLCCLLAADLTSSRGMGPIAAVGVLCALLAMTTLLPALLVLLGRRVFWPLVPVYGSAPRQRRSLFAAMGSSVVHRPVAVLTCGGVLLGALALGAFNMPGDLKQEDSFTSRPDSVVAMETLAAAYPERSTRPITVMTSADRAAETLAKARTTDGVAAVERGRSGGGWTELSVAAADHPNRRASRPPSRPCATVWTAATSAGPAPSRWTWRRPVPGI